MRIKLIALGHNQPRWVVDGCDEYSKRFGADWPFELVELKPEKRVASRATETLLAAEAERIRAQLPRQSLLVVLDERGEQVTTRSPL
jgi:23S rRNA (pseudouridine1915-N3)-methyltransferase